MRSAELSSSALHATFLGRCAEFRSALLHVNNHDAALRCVAVLFLALLVLGLRMPALVAHRNLQARPLIAPPLLVLATTDLFNDPRFEHATENL
jgi:hypothetical protein